MSIGKDKVEGDSAMDGVVSLGNTYREAFWKHLSSAKSGSIVATLFFAPYGLFELLRIPLGFSKYVDALFSIETFRTTLMAWFIVLGFGFWKCAQKAAESLVDAILFGTSFLCVILLWVSIFIKIIEGPDAQIQDGVIIAISVIFLTLAFFVAMSPLPEIAGERKGSIWERLFTSIFLIAFGMSLPWITENAQLIEYMMSAIVHYVGVGIYWFIYLVGWFLYKAYSIISWIPVRLLSSFGG